MVLSALMWSPVGTPEAPRTKRRGRVRETLKVAKSEKNSVVAWYWWQFHCAVPEDAGLGVPLAAHEEVALVAVAGDGEGELVFEGEVEGDGVAGGEGVGEGDLGYGVVLRVAVVGGGEVEGGGEVALAVGFDVGDFDGALLFVGVGVVGFVVADASAEVGLVGEGGLGAEGVEVEVEGEGGEGLAGKVTPGDGLGGFEGVVVWVDFGVEGVGGYAGGAGGGVGGDALGGQREGE